MKAKEQPILNKAVMDGVTKGVQKAISESKTPDANQLILDVHSMVMAEIREFFSFWEDE